MGVHTAFVLPVAIVFFCRETDQAFSVDVNSERVVAGHNNVDAQVELVPEEEQGVVDVSAYYAGFMLGDILRFIYNKDAFPLGTGLWFNDPHI
jgi:hypothetical protein